MPNFEGDAGDASCLYYMEEDKDVTVLRPYNKSCQLRKFG
jgi:hypothetical protein